VEKLQTKDKMLVHNYMRAATEFHVTFGMDHRSDAAKLRETILSVIDLHWNSGGMDSVKKCFVQYLRLLVRAQMLTDADRIESLVAKMKTDIAKGTKGSHELRGLLTYDESIVIELFVDLLHLRALKSVKPAEERSSAALGSAHDEERRSAKRQRPTSNSADLEWLTDDDRMFPKQNAPCHPRWYMHVLFHYLIKYPEDLLPELRADLVNKFARAFEQRSFEDLDTIWAMRCLDELLVSNQSRPDAKEWSRIFSSVLDMINGRRIKRMESFQAVSLNLLASIVSEGAIGVKDIEVKMSIVWKLIVTNWGQGVDWQERASASVSRSNQAAQDMENNAGRPVQDSLQVDVAFTAFLVAVLNRVPLSDDTVSVEGVTCSRKNLLNILLSKAAESGQNAVGHKRASRLKLTARLMTAAIGSGRGAHTHDRDSEQGCSAWCLRDMVAEARREGQDIFRDLDGEYVDVYSQARGRSGPDFMWLGDIGRTESVGLSFKRTARAGEGEDCRFERSLNSISTVMGWRSQLVPTPQLNDASGKWEVHLQTSLEEVRQLSKMCVELLRRFYDQDDPAQDVSPAAVPSPLTLAVLLLDSCTAASAPDRELTNSLCDYLFTRDVLFLAIRDTLDGWNTKRSMFEKKAMFESLEDIVDSLIRVLARPRALDHSTLDSMKGLRDILDAICSHCEQELGKGTSANQDVKKRDAMDDDFGGRRSEHQANLAYQRIRFRTWVKILTIKEDAQVSEEESVFAKQKPMFDAGLDDQPIEERLERLKVLCNHGLPMARSWKPTVKIIRELADKYINKEREFTRTDKALRYLKIATFLVEKINQPGKQVPNERKEVLLEFIRTDVLKWKIGQGYAEPAPRGEKTLKRSFERGSRILRQMYLRCAAKVVPVAVERLGQADCRALGEFISASLNDCAIEVRFEAAKGLGSAMSAFATRVNNVGIFKDILQKLETLNDMQAQTKLLSEEACVRTKALVFGEIAALDDEHASINVQAYCIAKLCSIFAHQPDSKDVVRSILRKVASRQNFSDSTELVRVHMPSILRDWWSLGIADQRMHWTGFPRQLAGEEFVNNEKLFVEQCAAPTLVPEILLHLTSNRDEVYSELGKIGNILMLRDRSHGAITSNFYAHIYSRILGSSHDPTMADKVQGVHAYIHDHMKDARRNTLHLTLRLLDLILDGNPTRWDPFNEGTHWSIDDIARTVIATLKIITPKGDPELYLLGIENLKTVGQSAASHTQTTSLGSVCEEQSPNDFLPQVYLHLLKALKGQGGRKVTRQQKERVLRAVQVVVECLGSLLTERIQTYPVRCVLKSPQKSVSARA
jgi:hypothetical protein